ncbi:hypothetical protein DFA_09975 [Cavenderia fasciculata]|uniref:Short-chain dehydrogenase n=1 Tax=Cavenderia fasciculata TaxID=261658 RepID=F4Q8Y2_CACFS|nr:uncharacterized protein DFA_09975 [Cavenderia fasciculata]EGG15151.1 hypothetical protein DFA_09975 [Cavenderia fasciculata]|eukprot:XP_004351871.1 hypothetical protein DFA_09975 [Cavenderia fasciculata]
MTDDNDDDKDYDYVVQDDWINDYHDLYHYNHDRSIQTKRPKFKKIVLYKDKKKEKQKQIICNKEQTSGQCIKMRMFQCRPRWVYLSRKYYWCYKPRCWWPLHSSSKVTPIVGRQYQQDPFLSKWTVQVGCTHASILDPLSPNHYESSLVPMPKNITLPIIDARTLALEYYNINWDKDPINPKGGLYNPYLYDYGQSSPHMDSQYAQTIATKLQDMANDLIGVYNVQEYLDKRQILFEGIVSVITEHPNRDNIGFIFSHIKSSMIPIIQTYCQHIATNNYYRNAYRHLEGVFNNKLLHLIEKRSRNYKLVQNSSFETDRLMENDLENPLFKLFGSNIGNNFISAHIGKKMVNNLTLFKECFKSFTSSVLSGITWGEIDGCKVVCGGSSVLASLTLGSEFMIDNYETFLTVEKAIAPLATNAKKIIQEYLSSAPSKRLFTHDGLKGLDELLDEPSWYTETHRLYNNEKSPYFKSDIDLFLITESEQSAIKRIKLLVKEITSSLPCDYHIIKTMHSLTILPTAYPYRPVQIVTATLKSYYEYLLKADIDCTCFLYDGNEIYTLLRGVRSIANSFNYISPHLLHRERSRIEKYFKRGYSFGATEIWDQSNSLDWLDDYKKKGGMFPLDRFGSLNVPELKVISMQRQRQRQMYRLRYGDDSDSSEQQLFTTIQDIMERVGPNNSFDLEALNVIDKPKMIGPNFVYHGWKILDQFIDQHIIVEPKSICTVGFSCYQCGELIFHWHTSIGEIPICNDCQNLTDSKWQQWDNIQVDQSRPKYALVTGARMKIGYYIAKRLLKSGFTVMVTTRFPWIAIDRYSREDDYSEWKDRLFVYGCDFRHLPSVQSMINHIKQLFPRLDILINNAAQTIRRPRAYFRELIEKEEYLSLAYGLIGHITQSIKFIKKNDDNDDDDDDDDYNQDNNDSDEIPTPKRTAVQLYNNELPKSIMECSLMTQIQLLDHDREERNDELFPPGQTDLHGEPLDNREQTTWRETIEETSPIEMMEVQLVNVTVPFMLISQLSPFMSNYIKTDGDDNDWKFIVNVSAQEGSFNKGYNHGHHTHTNMAKSSLNMMTYSIAESYLKKGIYVCGVDTGWCTKMTSQRKDGPQSPLNEFDGATRVLDPIASILLLGDDESKRKKMHIGGMFCHYRPQDNINYSHTKGI